MNINWQEGDKKYEIYPDGTYKIHIKDWEEVQAATGTLQIRWHCEILEPQEHVGKSITEHTPLTEASLWRLASFVGCIVDVNKLSNMEVGSKAFYDVLNACCKETMYWRLTQSVYNGKLRNQVEEYKQDPQFNLKEITVGDDDVPEFLKEDE